MKDKILTILYILFVTTILIISSFIVSDYKRKEELRAKTNDPTSSFIKINITDYENLFYGDELSFIYIASNNCAYCDKQSKVLSSVLEDVNFVVYYLNLDKISDEDYNNKLIASYDEFKENGIGTPTLLLVKNGEVVMFKKGLTSQTNILKLLLEYKYLK